MADPISLTMGAVALAGLFSTCVECFDYFIAAKSFREDLEILLVKLDLEKTRLLIWGNSVGVLRTRDEPEGRVAELDDVPKVQLITRCLNGVKSLLSDADKLQGRYGLQKATGKQAKNSGLVSSNSMNVFKASYSRFWVRFAKDENKASVLSRTRWAIHDKTNFEGLINNLKDLIDGLNEVLPVQRESQDLLVRRDISSILDITTLRLIQSACEGSYRSWSDEASRVIEESERGTIDRRHVEEWIRDAEGIDELNQKEQPQMSTQPRKHGLSMSDVIIII
jgi:Prion-inhibition and propagation